MSKRIFHGILFLINVLAGLFLHSSNPVYNWLTAICLAVVVTYFCKSNFPLFGPALFFLFAYLAALLPFAYLGLFMIVPLALYLVLVLFIRPLKAKSHWLKTGRIGTAIWLWGTIITIVSILALVTWAALFKPNLGDIMSIIPGRGLGTLLPIGVAFAVVNSLVEEAIYRGILWDGLNVVLGRLAVVNLAQAAIFGVAHIKGFPRGAVGVILAFIYGVFLGIIRHRTRGLLAPIIIHMVADLTIFMILMVMLEKL